MSSETCPVCGGTDTDPLIDRFQCNLCGAATKYGDRSDSVLPHEGPANDAVTSKFGEGTIPGEGLVVGPDEPGTPETVEGKSRTQDGLAARGGDPDAGGDPADLTLDQLKAQASELDIEGRSSMNKSQLAKAVKKANKAAEKSSGGDTFTTTQTAGR